jgi:hypothetical protein
VVYGDGKRREMARSILPSTRRDLRHERREIHKRERAAVRADLRRALFADLEEWAEDPDAGGRRKSELATFVFDRRTGDKLGPFLRWAAAATRGIAPGGRIAWLRRVLPKGVIGDHAVSHLRFDPVFLDANEAAVYALKWAR